MKKIFKLFSFLLVLVLSFLIVINTHAEGKNGFIEENGNTYYYENGELQKGIKEIDGNYYFLGEITGRVVTGMVTALDGTKYYANSKGILQTGFQDIEGTRYYFSKEDY